MSIDLFVLPPESPIASAYVVAERVAARHAEFETALEELANVLGETDLDQLERQVRNARERARPMARWLEMLPARIVSKGAP